MNRYRLLLIRRTYPLIIALVSSFLLLSTLSFADGKAEEAKALFSQGVGAFYEEMLPDAIGYFESALKLNPDFADAYVGLGAVYNMMGRYQDAAETLKKVGEMDPDYGKTHGGLIIFYKKLSGKSEPLKNLKKYIPFYLEDEGKSFDLFSIQCVECHKELIRSAALRGAKALPSHPVGASYESVYNNMPKDYVSPESLPGFIRLFKGRLGCATCHNFDSEKKFILVKSPGEGKLCNGCHIR